jgi:osmoprotectant transport system substrate-binding protein
MRGPFGRHGRGPRCAAPLLVAVAVVLVAACGPAATPEPAPDALHDRAITVASFDFAESRLLADLYGAALDRAGYDVTYARGLGPRELVDPALGRGLVELVPEYAGTAVEFLSLGDVHPSAEIATTHEALTRSLDGGNMVALDPAPAQTANAVVVTSETSTTHGLRTISDLAAVASGFVFGGPPECPHRPFCLEGLRDTYGLEFASFLPLDAGGPLTVEALEESAVDVALLFTTDPRIATDDLVELVDDEELQPAENITPLLHRAALRRFGPEMAAVVNGVSARLTTAELRELNRRVAHGESSADVARDWVTRSVTP